MKRYLKPITQKEKQKKRKEKWSSLIELLLVKSDFINIHHQTKYKKK
jgi:hypothetical protein